ncbi:MAG TPA: hypothetical protein VGA94_03455, partial [Thermodesulfobacteriota bacterium]
SFCHSERVWRPRNLLFVLTASRRIRFLPAVEMTRRMVEMTAHSSFASRFAEPALRESKCSV